MKGESHFMLAPCLLSISAWSTATQALACSPEAWVQCSTHMTLVRSYLCWLLGSQGARRCFVTKSALLWVWCIECKCGAQTGRSVTWERDLLQSISITLHSWQCGLFLLTCILWDSASIDLGSVFWTGLCMQPGKVQFNTFPWPALSPGPCCLPQRHCSVHLGRHF